MFLLILGLLLIAAIGISMALSIFLTRRYPQKALSSPAKFGLDFETIELVTSDHLHLRGWWIPAKDSQKTIIFLHGYAGSMDPDLKYALAIHQAGFNILMFDFRAHGRSEGNLTTIGALEVCDVQAAIDFALAHKSEQVGLLGFSMGGRTALLTAAQGEKRISALISDGGPLRLSFTIRQDLKEKGIPWGIRHVLTAGILFGASVRTGKNLFSSDLIHWKTGSTTLPVLLIHAGLDPYTRIEDLRSFVAELGENAKLEIIPGVHHRETDTLDFPWYVSRIITFFNESLN